MEQPIYPILLLFIVGVFIRFYLAYFQKKYIDKENIEFPNSLHKVEEHLSYDSISKMRKTVEPKML